MMKKRVKGGKHKFDITGEGVVAGCDNKNGGRWIWKIEGLGGTVGLR